MKILMVVQNLALVGGTEVFSDGLIRYLHSQGHKIQAITQGHRGLPCPVHLVPAGRFSKWATLRLVFRTLKTARDWDPDVIHFHGFDGLLLSALFLRQPVIISQHGFVHLRLVRLLNRLKPSLKFIANSQASRKLMKQLAGVECDESIYPLVHVGQPEARRVARKQLGVADDSVVVLHVGRLVECKGQDLLVQAAAEYCRNHPGAKALKVVIVGEGDLRKGLAGRISENRLEHAVELAGFIPHEQIGRWFAAADLYVQPSIHDDRVHAVTESFGISIMEAMAHGLPLVLSDLPVFREIAEGSESAVFFTEGRHVELAGLLESLSRDGERRRSMGKAAREHWERNFRPQVAFDRYSLIYQQILGQ